MPWKLDCVPSASVHVLLARALFLLLSLDLKSFLWMREVAPEVTRERVSRVASRCSQVLRPCQHCNRWQSYGYRAGRVYL